MSECAEYPCGMEVPEAVREMARQFPGAPIASPDTSQAFEQGGRMFVPPSAIIGFYLVDEHGNVTGYEHNLAYRMVVQT